MLEGKNSWINHVWGIHNLSMPQLYRDICFFIVINLNSCPTGHWYSIQLQSDSPGAAREQSMLSRRGMLPGFLLEMSAFVERGYLIWPLRQNFATEDVNHIAQSKINKNSRMQWNVARRENGFPQFPGRLRNHKYFCFIRGFNWRVFSLSRLIFTGCCCHWERTRSYLIAAAALLVVTQGPEESFYSTTRQCMFIDISIGCETGGSADSWQD